MLKDLSFPQTERCHWHCLVLRTASSLAGHQQVRPSPPSPHLELLGIPPVPTAHCTSSALVRLQLAPPSEQRDDPGLDGSVRVPEATPRGSGTAAVSTDLKKEKPNNYQSVTARSAARSRGRAPSSVPPLAPWDAAGGWRYSESAHVHLIPLRTSCVCDHSVHAPNAAGSLL